MSLDRFLEAYGESFPYHRENLGLLRAYAGFIRETMERRKTRSVLSLGIGHGVIPESLSSLASGVLDSYTIVEGSLASIDRFRYAHPQFRHEIVDSLFEAFETDRRFDLIEMGFVLEHIDDPEVVLRRFQRFLTPGGAMILAVPNALSLHRRLARAAGLLASAYSLSDHDRALGHVRYFDFVSLQELAAGCGLEILTAAGLMIKAFATSQLEQLDLSSAVWEALFSEARDFPEIANAFAVECELKT